MSRAPLTDALAWLDGQRSRMEELLARLVDQNSFTGNRTGVSAVAAMLADELDRLGLAPERIASKRFGDHLAFHGPAQGPPAFLLGHMDTVFPPGSFDRYAARGDRARGPGVFDMKGGLVVTLFALEALARAGLVGRVPLAGMWVADEEVGSPESQAILRARVAGASCALCFESGRDGDAIVTSRKGIASLEAVAEGIAAHAGNEHDKGRNAIWALARFVDRVQELTDYGRGVTVNVGLIAGGTTRNTVPASARCEIDVRFVSPREGDHAIEEIREAARSRAIEGTRIELRRGAWRPPLVRTEASAALAREYGACQAESGLGSGEAPLVGGGSDAATTGAAGVPSIDGLGPRGSGYHTAAEEVDLRSLVPKASALLRFLARRAA